MRHILMSFLIASLAICSVDFCQAYAASSHRSRWSDEGETSEDIFRVLMKLAKEVIGQSKSEKRGIDLGLSRGFSGSQAAKHLMGLEAANFANGPGRRRRDLESQ